MSWINKGETTNYQKNEWNVTNYQKWGRNLPRIFFKEGDICYESYEIKGEIHDEL